MKYKFLIIVILISITISLNGNSIFSFEGMPNQYYGNDVYGLGMGETGVADLFRVNTNYSNPSLTVTANKVIFSTAFTLGNIWYMDSEDNGFKDDGAYFPFFVLAVPISNHKFAFSFNSQLSGNIENEQSNSWEGFSYDEINKISATILKADIIYALKNDYVNFGLSLNYYIGHRTRYWKLDFEDIEMIDTKYEIEKSFGNPGFSVGFSKKIENISMGITYSSYAELEGDVIYKYGHSPYVDTLDLVDNGLFEIPKKIFGGITWKFLEKYKTSVDLHYEMWEETKIYDKNTLKAAIGFAYDPLSGYGNWWERIPFRFGCYYRELPFEKSNNKIIEKGVSFGSSIPLKTPNKKIDFAVKYLIRGNLGDHGVRDKSVMFHIGITGFDIFTKKYKRTEERDIPKPD